MFWFTKSEIWFEFLSCDPHFLSPKKRYNQVQKVFWKTEKETKSISQEKALVNQSLIKDLMKEEFA
jgi:hypothetical protein